jgi:hypothetical protein
VIEAHTVFYFSKMFNSRMKENKRGIDDFDAMTNELCYHKKEGLKQRRVNA